MKYLHCHRLLFIIILFAFDVIISEHNHHHHQHNEGEWPIEAKTLANKSFAPTIILILTRKVHQIRRNFHWIKKLDPKEFTVVFVEDIDNKADEKNELIQLESGAFLAHMKTYFAFWKNYHHVTMVGGVTSWDRALLLMGRIFPRDRFYWIMESDVLVPTVHAFRKLHDEAMKRKADFVGTRRIGIYHGESEPTDPWKWNDGVGNVLTKMLIDYPYYHGMACAIGFSQKMVDTLSHFVHVAGSTEYLEVWYYTIALGKNSNLTAYLTPVFDGIVYKADHTCTEVANHALDRWFHPVKNQSFADHCIQTGKWNSSIIELME